MTYSYKIQNVQISQRPYKYGTCSSALPTMQKTDILHIIRIQIQEKQAKQEKITIHSKHAYTNDLYGDVHDRSFIPRYLGVRM